MTGTMAKKKKPKPGMTAAEFRALLAGLGVTQAKAAESLGVHLNTVNNWATGRAMITPAGAALVREKLRKS